MVTLKFTKMHGAGNDFVFVNNLNRDIEMTPERAKFICDRKFGIGADQLLIVSPVRQAGDLRMDIFNSDGGEVEMCGNGIRCFSKYVLDAGITQKTELEVETLAGIIKPQVIADHPQTTKDTIWVRVDMGEPILEGGLIPTTKSGMHVNMPFSVDGESLKVTCVSMGNPHCVTFVDEDVNEYPVAQLGPKIELNEFFPNRTNVEFVEVLGPTELRQRTWERGAGETLACGTGACAVGVASVLNGKTERKMTIHLKGGDLEIEWDQESNHVFMTGPATTVFEGEIEIN